MKKALPASRAASAEWPISVGSKAMRPSATNPAPRPNILRAAANPERKKEADARWAAEHPEKAKAKGAKWYTEHSEKVKIAAAKWAAEHPEKVKAIKSKWSKTHPLVVRAQNSRRNARKRSAIGSYTASEFRVL